MKKKAFALSILIILSVIVFSGCSHIGNKTTSMSAIYGVTTVLSLLLLGGYVFFIKEKHFWFYVLFISVFIVNAGYFYLSVSDNLPQALQANRISYLGSVFLPLSMIMIIIKVTKLKYKKWLPKLLTVVSLIVFIIAASPGYLDIYYKSVELEITNGVAVLSKDYGPWHCVYLFYLSGYFILMASVVFHAISKKKLESTSHAIILIVSVFVNICVWLLEQLVKVDFEFLSISYIITELFLISVYLMIQHQNDLIESIHAKYNKRSTASNYTPYSESEDFAQVCVFFKEHLSTLTPTEKAIYKCYVAGMSTKDVLQEMSISENTLKFHNKNIYAKLGVSSRKQLKECAKYIQNEASHNDGI